MLNMEVYILNIIIHLMRNSIHLYMSNNFENLGKFNINNNILYIMNPLKNNHQYKMNIHHHLAHNIYRKGFNNINTSIDILNIHIYINN